MKIICKRVFKYFVSWFAVIFFKKRLTIRDNYCIILFVVKNNNISVEGFPSGQRGQTVNLLSVTSMVRIHLPPPPKPCTYALTLCAGFLPFMVNYFRSILYKNVIKIFYLENKKSAGFGFSGTHKNWRMLNFFLY